MSVQQILLLILCGMHLVLSAQAWSRCRTCGHAFTPVPWWVVMSGSFVWGDVLVFSPFWFLVLSVSFIVNDILLLGVVISLFWSVRSAGEVLYWFHQQFSTIERNKPKDLVGFGLVRNDAIWFVYQIFWQCILVISLLASIVSSAWWLPTLLKSS